MGQILIETLQYDASPPMLHTTTDRVGKSKEVVPVIKIGSTRSTSTDKKKDAEPQLCNK
jgi:hypothetical protein